MQAAHTSASSWATLRSARPSALAFASFSLRSALIADWAVLSCDAHSVACNPACAQPLHAFVMHCARVAGVRLRQCYRGQKNAWLRRLAITSVECCQCLATVITRCSSSAAVSARVSRTFFIPSICPL